MMVKVPLRRAFVIGVIWLVALLTTPATALGQSAHDKDSDGKFTGLALITSDLEWYKLFQSSKTPVIESKDRFRANDHGVVALIFASAKPRDGVVRVECDVTAFDSKGSKRIVDGGVCYEGPSYPDYVLVPALLDIHFEIGSSDPPGPAGFQITMRDVYSGREVQLRVGFEQDTGK